MKRLLAFIGIGSFFATVEVFLTVVVLRNDFGSYLFLNLFYLRYFLQSYSHIPSTEK